MSNRGPLIAYAMGVATLYGALASQGCGIDDPTSAGGTIPGGDASAGAAGTAGNVGFGGTSGNTGVGGTFSLDGSSQDGLTKDVNCGSSSVQAEKIELDVYYVLDTSGSMHEPSATGAGDCNIGGSVNSKWCNSINAMYGFFAEPSSAGMGAALGTFGGSSCSPVSNPAIGLAPLPTHLAGLEAAMNQPNPNGGTPTEAAVRGIIDYTLANKQPNRKMIGVLITDGDPTRCNTSIGNLNQLLVNHYTTNDIATYVIGMNGATFSNLEGIGVNAGAQPHTNYCGGSISPCSFYNVGNGDKTVFIEALKAIQENALGCEFTVPTDEGGMTDVNKVNVKFTRGDGTQETLVRVDGEANCVPSAWYYDDPSNPTKILLCSDTCTSVSADLNGKIDILLGCETVTPN